MAATISLDCHKFRQAKRKPGYSHQTYFSFPSLAPFSNAHVHAEKYGWLARLELYNVMDYDFILLHIIIIDMSGASLFCGTEFVSLGLSPSLILPVFASIC